MRSVMGPSPLSSVAPPAVRANVQPSFRAIGSIAIAGSAAGAAGTATYATWAARAGSVVSTQIANAAIQASARCIVRTRSQ